MKFFQSLALMFVVSFTSVQAQNLSIATGGTGGVYYPMGGGLAAVLSKHVAGMSATAEVTGGSVDNLNLINSGKPYLAFTMADAAKTRWMARESSRIRRLISKLCWCFTPIGCMLSQLRRQVLKA